MTDHVTPERIAANAEASGIPIDAATAARVASGISPTAARFRAGAVGMPFETEPSTYVVVSHQEIKR